MQNLTATNPLLSSLEVHNPLQAAKMVQAAMKKTPGANSGQILAVATAHKASTMRAYNGPSKGRHNFQATGAR